MTRQAGLGLATGSLTNRRWGHTATLLKEAGNVLVTGGYNTSGALHSAELFHPRSGTWTATSDLNTGRFVHTATLLQDGTVLVAGGIAFDTQTTNTAELGHGAR